MKVFRFTKVKYEASAYDGEGARIGGGRWNSPGLSAVYTSDSPALAVTEVLVGLQSGESLKSYVMLAAELPDDLIEDLARDQWPTDWQAYPPPQSTRAVGDAFLSACKSLALRVPAVPVLGFNFLINPRHLAFGKFKPLGRIQQQVDPRLDPALHVAEP